jgi:hypothetical protein
VTGSTQAACAPSSAACSGSSTQTAHPPGAARTGEVHTPRVTGEIMTNPEYLATGDEVC